VGKSSPDIRAITVTSHSDQGTTPRGDTERLDRYLARQYTDLSRSRIASLIRDELVTVNGEAPRSSLTVRPGMVIRLVVPPPEEPSLEPEDIPLDIRFEDSHLLVVNKPAGLVVHPAPGHPSGTLINALLAHCTDLEGVGGVLRPGIVHRLDKDTSGLMLVAKTDRAHGALSDALKVREIGRNYLAVVWGHPDPAAGEVATWIGRSSRDRKKMAVFEPRSGHRERRWGRPGEAERLLGVRESAVLADGGPAPTGSDEDGAAGSGAAGENGLPPGIPSRARRAVTHYRTLAVSELAALLECRLETGRTHQIRVHAAHLGHPVVGDPVYGGREKAVRGMLPERRGRARELLALIDRQALHAARLSFTHPVSGERIDLAAEPPADLQALIGAEFKNTEPE